MSNDKSERELLLDVPARKFVRLRAIVPSGALEGYKTVSGMITFYWRGAHNKKIQRVKIGLWDPRLPPKAMKPSKLGYTIEGAAARAQEIAMIHLENRDSGGYLGAVREQKELERQEQERQKSLSSNTLQALLQDYSNYQQVLGRKSHAESRGVFNLHVFTAHPKLSAKPANSVTAEQIADVLRSIHEAGKGRTANKLRAYIRAAYETALKAKLQANIPAKFKDYRITHNPVTEIEPDRTANKSGKNPLSLNEMRLYWKLINQVGGLKGQMLRLHLLTGGQRMEQFVRLLAADVTESTIKLYDNKGKPGATMREILIPLIDAAKAEIPRGGRGQYIFTTDDRTHVQNTTLARWAKDTVGDEIQGFQLKRVRSGVETLLSSRGISREVRGRLLSHGIGGVQDKNYDGHDYLDEKRQALEVLFNAVNSDE